MTEKRQEIPLITLETIKKMYYAERDADDATEKPLLWLDGDVHWRSDDRGMALNFACLTAPERRGDACMVIFPPAEEWTWGANGVPLDPLMLFEERGGVDESQIQASLPLELRGDEVRYTFVTCDETRKVCIDPRRMRQATHIWLWIRRNAGVDWSARWGVAPVTKELEAARDYCAAVWGLLMKANEEAFEKFWAERRKYKAEMLSLLVDLPLEWSKIDLDGKHDGGQYLELQAERGRLGGGGAGFDVMRRCFRYDEEGREELEEFLKTLEI